MCAVTRAFSCGQTLAQPGRVGSQYRRPCHKRATHRELPRSVAVTHGYSIQPHQRIPQIHLSGRISWRLRLRPEQEELPPPPALPPEPVSGQVAQRAAQVALGVAVDPAPLPEQPLDRALQQILAGLDAPGEQDRSAQQGLPALGEELFQLLDPLILRHEGCLLLPPSKYEQSRLPVTLPLARTADRGGGEPSAIPRHRPSGRWQADGAQCRIWLHARGEGSDDNRRDGDTG